MTIIEIDSKASRGLKLIRGFDEGKILDVVGDNGIGKSSAARVFTIATGDIHFRNRRQFERFRSIIGETIISIKHRDSEYNVKFQPMNWELDEDEMIIVANTIGIFERDGTRIDAEEFQRKFEAKVIRGDETLATQIERVGEFISKSIRHKKRIADVEYDKRYAEFSDLEARVISNVETMETLNQKAIESQKKLEDYESELEKERAKTNTLVGLRGEVQSLAEWEHYDLETLRAEAKDLTELEESLRGEIEELTGEISKLQAKTDSKAKKEIRAWKQAQKKRDKSEREVSGIREQIASLDGTQEVLREVSTLGLEKTIQKQRKRIQDLQQELAGLGDETEKVGIVQRCLQDIQRVVKTAVAQGVPDETAFSIPVQETERFSAAQVSFRQLGHLVDRHLLTIQPEHLASRITEQKELATKLEAATELKDQMEKLDEFQRNLDASKQKIQDLVSKLESSEDELRLEIDQLEKIKNLREQRNEDYINTKADLKQHEARITLLETYPAKEDLAKRISELLNQLGMDGIYDSLMEYENVSKLVEELRKIMDESNRQLGVYEGLKEQELDEQNKLKKKLKKTRTHLEGLAEEEEIELEEFINKSRREITHLRKLAGDLKAVSDCLGDLEYALGHALEGRSARSQTPIDKHSLEDVEDLFNRFFVDTYSAPSFMTNVFHEYDGVVGFDLSNRDVRLYKGGDEIVRTLEDFSSGEKSYAYARAMMSIPMTRGEVKVLFLDEFEALLDYEHSKDLRTFEIEIITDGLVSKIINIHPDKTPLDQRKLELERLASAGDSSGDSELVAFAKEQLEEINRHIEEVDKWRHYQIARF